MTLTELYEWAKENGVEDYDIVTIHDTGMGTCLISETYIDHEKKEVEVY